LTEFLLQGSVIIFKECYLPQYICSSPPAALLNKYSYYYMYMFI